MQIGKVKITPYLKASMKFCPHFIYFYSDLDKIWYRSPCRSPMDGYKYLGRSLHLQALLQRRQVGTFLKNTGSHLPHYTVS